MHWPVAKYLEDLGYLLYRYNVAISMLYVLYKQGIT